MVSIRIKIDGITFCRGSYYHGREVEKRRGNLTIVVVEGCTPMQAPP